MAARLDGTLLVIDRCVWVSYVDQRYLVVWPSSYGWRLRAGVLQILERDRTVVATQGGPISIGGGEVARTENEAQSVVQELTGTAIPARCGAALVWSTGGVITE